uniref:Uncharacterized protein n=1 Tax=Podarcis muralis TaxID=64176 RepID=A0A670J657_PODMU
MRMTDTVIVKERGDTMKNSEMEVKDNIAVQHFIKSESHEQIQVEKNERCTDNKNDVQEKIQITLKFTDMLYSCYSMSSKNDNETTQNFK